MRGARGLRERPAPSREAGERRGAPPWAPSRRDGAGLAAGASVLPRNLRPQDWAGAGWPGEAGLRGPVEIRSRVSPPEAEEAGPGDAGGRGAGGLPGLGQGALLPLYPLPRVLRERVIVRFPGESKGIALGLVRCQSRCRCPPGGILDCASGGRLLSPLNNFDRCSALSPY